jgi:hypothetical protein
MSKIWKPHGFKASVKTRLRELVEARGRTNNQQRALLLMERFLARVIVILPNTTVLKGGLALELRLDQARTTKDLDLRVLGDPKQLDRQLRDIQSYRPTPEDFFHFTIEKDRDNPEITGVNYVGFRYKVEATLTGKRFASFCLDIAYGDPILGQPDLVVGSDFFTHYDIPPVSVPTYPAPTHLAEKLHAYTLPRDRVNMRMKDLIDMPLLGRALDETRADLLHEAFSQTFNFRKTHPLPSTLPSPPDQWSKRYDRDRAVENLPWKDLTELHAAAAALVNPVLAGLAGVWSTTQRQWIEDTPRSPAHQK